ncbi:MAG: N-acetylmuramoyl-L-alanine amidase, partial [Myxococcales bacterium]
EEKQPDAEKKPDEAKTESAPPSVVATLDGVHFEFDKSFALPGAIPTWRGIHAFLKKSPNRRVLVVGHTDKTGEEDYNLALSKERAEMAAAALRGDADTWYKHYEHRDAGKKWGKREDGWMLNKLGFLKKEPKDASADETTAAMRAFQKKNTLQGDGKPSEATRKALIRQYLDLNGSSSNAVNGAQVLGCGERHPKEGASNAELRRVEIFLFDGEIKPEPSKCAKADHPGCTAYDAWLKEKTGDVPPEDVAAGPQSTPEADALEKAQKKVDDLKKKYAPKIVSRADWGARPRKDDPKWVDYPADQPLPLTNIVVHHTSTVHLIGGGLKLTVKELQNFEMDENKYSDMPYHFVIGADGKIYEGREMKSVGAHAGEIDGNTDIKKDPDWGSVGIVLMGDFEGDLVGKDSPTPEELKSLHDLTCHLLLEYEGIKPDKILKHSEVVRSGPPKACPGKRMAPKVDELKASPDLKEIEDALKELRDAKAKANGN